MKKIIKSLKSFTTFDDKQVELLSSISSIYSYSYEKLSNTGRVSIFKTLLRCTNKYLLPLHKCKTKAELFRFDITQAECLHLK